MVTQDTTSKPPIDVMIAEDSTIQAEVLRRRLVKEGYTVRIGNNGSDALRQIRQQRPAILISDIEMPEMNGYELCRSIKDDPKLRTVPVILLTTLSDPEDIVNGMHAGADNYVTKPYDPDYLLSRITSLLSTPIDDEEFLEHQELEIKVAGRSFDVKLGRCQALNLLVSTFENAIEKNRELVLTNERLVIAQDEVRKHKQLLESLNNELDSANEEARQDLEAAAIVQQSLLPGELPDVEAVSVAWKYSPCNKLAGDFLNIHQLDDHHLGMYIVDVSGHGIGASLRAVSIGRALIPTYPDASLFMREVTGSDTRQIASAEEVMSELIRRFPMETWGDHPFAIAYGVLDIKSLEFRYVSAGHCPIVHMTAAGQTELLAAGDYPIGWLERAEGEERAIQLSMGDRLLIYSDGIPDAMNPEKGLFGDEPLRKAFAQSRTDSLEESLTSLIDQVEAWCGEPGPQDDVLLLGIEINLPKGTSDVDSQSNT